MFRVVTIGREFGSGGAAIAQRIAERLQWRLLDNALMTEIGQRAQIAPEVLKQFDEHVDPWVHRLVRSTFQRGGFEGVSYVPAGAVLDAQRMAQLTHALIREAAELGNCVIVGRGAQCVLQKRSDAFHVFVYGPLREKIARVRERLPDVKDVEALIRATDAKREEYVRFNFGCEWKNPHLYHLLVCSGLGEEKAAELILAGVQSKSES